MTRLWTGASAAALVAAAMLWSATAGAQQPQSAAQAQTQPGAAPSAPLPWPRAYDLPDNQLLQLYQPQIDAWNGDTMSGRAAVAIGAKTGTPTYGMVKFTTRVAIDKPAGIVHFAAFTIDSVQVPTEPAKESAIRAALQTRLPPDGMTVPLDQLQASYAVNQELSKIQTQPVDNTPPQILFATTTTILVPISGDPVLRPIKGVSGIQRVINTRPLLLKDDAGTFHLEAAGHWYETPTLGGPWVLTPQVPATLATAAKSAIAETPADPLLNSDNKPIDPAPAIMVATRPAELVQTDGQPQMLPVAGTNLLTMNNADHAVFMETTSNSYFILISGRWFKAQDLKGPWTFVASNALPKDFAKISPNDPKANVLVSVAGTPQAKEAAIAATIPQTATVKRDVQLKVAYEGAPKFETISGTALAYAVNTATPVIRVAPDRFYAVNNGTWFVAVDPAGPWRVADAVPDVIYSIPVSSPVHYVTYVRIYASTPDTVVVGYTPGYMGVVVAPGGTVVYGTGYSCVGYIGAVDWYSCPITYGVGAGFALGIDTGFAFGFAAGWGWGAAVYPYWGPYWHPYGPYGPYGPCGPWGGHWGYTNLNQTNLYGRWGGAATVNHAWGTTWNGTEWSGRDWRGTTAGGTNFAGRSGAAFNPYSGNYAAGRENARYNPTTGARGESRAGVEGNAYTGNAAAGRESAGANPTTGTYHASQTGVTDKNGNVNVDSRGVAGNAKTGNAVAWDNGHVAVDHDGNVYKRNDNGSGWSQRTTSGWQNTTRDTSNLDREDQARSWGDQRVSSYGGDGFGGDAYGRGDSFGSGGFDRDFGGFGGGDRFGGGGWGGGGRGFGGGFGGGRR